MNAYSQEKHSLIIKEHCAVWAKAHGMLETLCNIAFHRQLSQQLIIQHDITRSIATLQHHDIARHIRSDIHHFLYTT